MRHDAGAMTQSEPELRDRIARAREEYHSQRFDIEDLAPTWHEQFDLWFEAAADTGLREPHAMVLATAGADGAPSARTVLLRGLDSRGLEFHTNRRSLKGRELTANPHAAVVFPWIAIHRQITAGGTITLLSDAESDAYWESRPAESRLSALASPQSEVVRSRAVLEELRAARAAEGSLDRPDHWGGYLLTPTVVEFWQGREHRFHDRLRYRLSDNGWLTERLAP
jgi:pyridoxamine 5'-phosphate oxidase